MPLGKRHNPGHAGDPAERKEVAHVQKSRSREQALPLESIWLVDQIHEVPRYHHYSYKTEQIYVSWIVRFIRFSGTRHFAEMGKPRKFRDSIRIYRATLAPKVSKG
jgi:hypothetical protein